MFLFSDDQTSSAIQTPNLQTMTSNLPHVVRKDVTVPAQVWEKMSDCYSATSFIEKMKGMLSSVKTFEFEGFLYTVTSIHYSGRSNGRNTCHAWKLIPQQAFTGECFTDPAFASDPNFKGRRDSYQHTLVQCRGVRYVLDTQVEFVRGLPTTKPLSLQRANSHDEENRKWGWRSLKFKGNEPVWKSLNGHPVAIYEDTESDEKWATLLWTLDGEIHDFQLSDSQMEQLQSTSYAVVPSQPELPMDIFHSAIQVPRECMQASLF